MLIKNVNVNKVIFPIEEVKYLSNEEFIEILKELVIRYSLKTMILRILIMWIYFYQIYC